MRKNIRDNLIEVISTILDAHEVALKYAKSGEIDLVMSVFTECQEAMVKMGEIIEENEGEIRASWLEDENVRELRVSGYYTNGACFEDVFVIENAEVYESNSY